LEEIPSPSASTDAAVMADSAGEAHPHG